MWFSKKKASKDGKPGLWTGRHRDEEPFSAEDTVVEVKMKSSRPRPPGLEMDSKYTHSDSVPLDDLLGEPKNLSNFLKSSIFIYGKIWFYNAILRKLLGNDWSKSRKYRVVHNIKDLQELQQVDERKKKYNGPVILIPSVQTQNELNELLSKSLETNLPVWFVGYPSTLQKHLLITFEYFFICFVSEDEMRILQDVTEITDDDGSYLMELDKNKALLASATAFPEVKSSKQNRMVLPITLEHHSHL